MGTPTEKLAFKSEFENAVGVAVRAEGKHNALRLKFRKRRSAADRFRLHNANNKWRSKQRRAGKAMINFCRTVWGLSPTTKTAG